MAGEGVMLGTVVPKYVIYVHINVHINILY